MPNAATQMWKDNTVWQVAVLRRSGSLSAELLRQFRGVEKRMIALILSALYDGNENQRYRDLRSAMVEVRERVTAAFGSYQAAIGSHVLEIISDTTRHASASFARALDLDDLTRGLKELTDVQVGKLAQSVEIQGRSLATWWQRTEAGFLDKLNALGRTSIASNWERKDALRDLRGIMKRYRRNIRSMTLTSGALASNSARVASYEKNPNVVDGLEWVATLDLRTTDICLALHRKRWTLDRQPIGNHGFAYPAGGVAHFRERSITTAYIASGTVDRLKGRKAASFKGPIDADTSMDAFLRSLSDDELRKVFPPGKLRLWKQGKVSLEDLVTSTGDPVPLRELI